MRITLGHERSPGAGSHPGGLGDRWASVIVL
jgi:hypothetical protein